MCLKYFMIGLLWRRGLQAVRIVNHIYSDQFSLYEGVKNRKLLGKMRWLHII